MWIDCEMTGLSLQDDALIEVAALVTDFDLNVLGEGVDLVIKPPAQALAQMNEFVTTMHTTSGLLTELERPSASVNELRRGIDAMGHLVEQILVLNRTAPDQYMVQFQHVDLYALAREVVSNEFEQILQRGQDFELEGGASEPSMTDGIFFTVLAGSTTLQRTSCRWCE